MSLAIMTNATKEIIACCLVFRPEFFVFAVRCVKIAKQFLNSKEKISNIISYTEVN